VLLRKREAPSKNLPQNIGLQALLRGPQNWSVRGLSGWFQALIPAQGAGSGPIPGFPWETSTRLACKGLFNPREVPQVPPWHQPDR